MARASIDSASPLSGFVLVYCLVYRSMTGSVSLVAELYAVPDGTLVARVFFEFRVLVLGAFVFAALVVVHTCSSLFFFPSKGMYCLGSA